MSITNVFFFLTTTTMLFSNSPFIHIINRFWQGYNYLDGYFKREYDLNALSSSENPWAAFGGIKKYKKRNFIFWFTLTRGKSHIWVRVQGIVLFAWRPNVFIMNIASDWLKQIFIVVRPIRSTTQIWVVTRHQYGIFAVVSQTSFLGETSGGVGRCRLFSHVNNKSHCRSLLLAFFLYSTSHAYQR